MHLLNNNNLYRPYDERSLYSRGYRRNPTWGRGNGYGTADKAKYVNANYRFVVSPSGVYSTHATNADATVQWADVLQVIASAESQATSCPICLSEPVSPRMAKCGHIFCLPCFIRYMNSSSDEAEITGTAEWRQRWKKCPICDDTIYLTDVRPVRFHAGLEGPLPRPGDDVVLRLMVRNLGSTLALPIESGSDVLGDSPDIPWHFAATVMDYGRIMKGTRSYMMEQYDNEIEDLQKQEREDELQFGEDGGEWTRRAVRSIIAAKERVPILDEKDDNFPVGSTETVASSSNNREYDFYFYTTLPHLYLTPLDIRILKTKYGSFSSFPSTLLPRVEHISTGHVVDDAMRKKARYLSHLPHGCIISWLECDWTDIVPAETLNRFSKEIEERRKTNRDKAAQEERERLEAEQRAVAEAMACLPRPILRRGGADGDGIIADDEGYRKPVVDLADFQPLVPGDPGTTPPNPRLGFGSLAGISTSPSAPRTVWGTPAAPVSPTVAAATDREPPHREFNDGWLKDEEIFRESMELTEQPDGHAAQANRVSMMTDVATGGKKKKKQKITLMSTGGRRMG